MNRAIGETPRLLGRMLLVPVVIGTAQAAAATERVTLSLVVSGTIGWSFVPLVQLATGLLLVRGVDQPRVTLLERYFATGSPWLLWILAFHGVLTAVPPVRTHAYLMLLTAAVPIAWTAILLRSFCRDELRLADTRCRRRLAVHQAMTYGVVLAWIWVAVALQPRIMGMFG